MIRRHANLTRGQNKSAISFFCIALITDIICQPEIGWADETKKHPHHSRRPRRKNRTNFRKEKGRPNPAETIIVVGKKIDRLQSTNSTTTILRPLDTSKYRSLENAVNRVPNMTDKGAEKILFDMMRFSIRTTLLAASTILITSPCMNKKTLFKTELFLRRAAQIALPAFIMSTEIKTYGLI